MQARADIRLWPRVVSSTTVKSSGSSEQQEAENVGVFYKKNPLRAPCVLLRRIPALWTAVIAGTPARHRFHGRPASGIGPNGPPQSGKGLGVPPPSPQSTKGHGPILEP
jgi:hypothetical protein